MQLAPLLALAGRDVGVQACQRIAHVIHALRQAVVELQRAHGALRVGENRQRLGARGVTAGVAQVRAAFAERGHRARQQLRLGRGIQHRGVELTHREQQQRREMIDVSFVHRYSSFFSVAISCTGLKGLTIQPVAPARLPSIFFSWLDSVVSISIGVSR